jgi:hypothetical protein
MPRPTVFISYRHGDPSTLIAREVHTALDAVADGLGFDLFMDQHDNEPGDLFDKVILEGLDRTTHFLALLDNDYWASKYCHKELAHAITRYEKGDPVRILFVKAGAIKPEYMMLKKDREAGQIKTEPLIERIGDLQFLGPFDKARRLERLTPENINNLRDQISDLIDELARVLPKPA